MLDEQTIKEGRDRLVQVFRYLEALHDRRNPPIKLVTGHAFSLRLRDMPSHACVEELGEDFILKVRRPTLTPCQPPPNSVRMWLRNGWDNPSATPSHLDEIASNSAQNPQQFDHDETRVRDWKEWIARWNAWAPTARIERNVERVYQSLYEQHSILERDGERFELMLGDGFISWILPEGRVNHPLLLQPAELLFDAPSAEFTIVESARPVEFYTAALRTSEVDAAVLARARDQIDKSDEIHPLEDLITDGFLKGLAKSLHGRGDYADAPVTGDSDVPCIYRDRVVFRRNKTAGMGQAIRQVLEELTKESEEDPPTWMTSPPEGLFRFVGIETRDDEDRAGQETLSRYPEDDEGTYFTKPANHEQYQIVRKLNSSGCVLVQGPPGTGKTHTIANLIGHLLAKGKSVLVTSHTTKALTVVTDKVAKPLQPLCVSVLESDRANRDRLEMAVQSIADGLTGDTSQLPRRAEELKNLRADLHVQIQDLRNRLRMARNAEYEPLAYRGNAIRPIEAAKEVARDRASKGWIPGPLGSSDYPPLTAEEFRELYESNACVSAEDEANYPDEVPDLDSFIAPDEFDTLISSLHALRAKDLDLPSNLVPNRASEDEAVIERANTSVADAIRFLADGEAGWKRQLVDLARRGEGEVWLRVAKMATDVAKLAMDSEERQYRFAPKWNGGVDVREAISGCREIEDHLAAGKRLNGPTLLLRPGWRRILSDLSMADGPAVSREHFTAAREAMELQQKRHEFGRVWNGRMLEISGPTIPADSQRPERLATPYVNDIVASVKWYREDWPTIEASITNAGITIGGAVLSVPVSSASSAEIDRLVSALTEVILPLLHRLADRAEHIRLERRQGELKMWAQRIAAQFAAIPLVQQIHQAVSEEDCATYRNAYYELRSIYGRADVIRNRRDLLKRLAESTPLWSQSVRLRAGVHGGWEVPGEIDAAWRWKRLDQELESRARVSIQALASELSEKRDECERVTMKLVEALSWGGLVKRTSITMRMALSGYVQILRRIGKGTGKRAPRLILEAQKLMADSQQAVPVWVMPLSRVVESFDLARAKFDVVIVDEASQMDLNGLLAMFMAKQVVIVGDDKQVEPLDVGTKLDDVQALIDEHLRGIPRWQLWDGKQSVYSLADGPFEPIRLREHFRCVPDIIRFSNRLSYNGSILPLREDAQVVTRPFVVPHYVGGASSDNRGINRKEADTLVALMKAVSEQPEYEGKSFGVIHLVGDNLSEQARYVTNFARTHIGEVELEARHFRCGNSAQFQGDERDIMFLSTVDVPGNGPLSMRSEELFKKRYNVAASRAKDQMWILYSLDPSTDLKPGDLRRELIEFALDPTALERIYAEKSSDAESDFELRMLRRLVSAGYGIVEPQYKVGAYRIDFAIRHNEHRIAIECDGDRFHGADKLDEDMARQSTLERLGWRFIRVRGTEFYRDEDAAVNRVVEALSGIGIPPSSISRDDAPDPFGDELLVRVNARAAEIMEEWQSSEQVEPQRLSGTPWRRGGPTDAGNEQSNEPQAQPRAENPEPAQARFTYTSTSRSPQNDPNAHPKASHGNGFGHAENTASDTGNSPHNKEVVSVRRRIQPPCYARMRQLDPPDEFDCAFVESDLQRVAPNIDRAGPSSPLYQSVVGKFEGDTVVAEVDGLPTSFQIIRVGALGCEPSTNSLIVSDVTTASVVSAKRQQDDARREFDLERCDSVEITILATMQEQSPLSRDELLRRCAIRLTGKPIDKQTRHEVNTALLRLHQSGRIHISPNWVSISRTV